MTPVWQDAVRGQTTIVSVNYTFRENSRNTINSFGYFPLKFACFFHFSPTKDLAPFSIYTPQKTLS